jgi:hypothetical protein
MPTGVSKGAFAHVAGTFDLAAKKGTIDYMTPVSVATDSNDFENAHIHLVGENKQQAQIFDKPVNPQRNSCAPNATMGTFEEYIPVSPDLARVRLTIDGHTAAEFSRGQRTVPSNLTLGAPDPSAPHRTSIAPTPVAQPAVNVTYTVQAKADGGSWQTVALGLPLPTANIDVNQFPSAKRLEIRVLQSDGFEESEVFRQVKTF